MENAQNRQSYDNPYSTYNNRKEIIEKEEIEEDVADFNLWEYLDVTFRLFLCAIPFVYNTYLIIKRKDKKSSFPPHPLSPSSAGRGNPCGTHILPPWRGTHTLNLLPLGGGGKGEGDNIKLQKESTLVKNHPLNPPQLKLCKCRREMRAF